MGNVITKISRPLQEWVNRNAGNDYLFYVVAAFIGLLSGLGAALLKGGITFVMHLIFSVLNIHTGNWVFILLPIFAILLTTVYVRYVVHSPLDHATERIKQDLVNGTSSLSPRIIFGSLVGCSLTLGMGGSAGAESPIAYTGAAIGSNVGRALRYDSENTLHLLGCGAAAGIAGIYMAPIGGVMYALEVLKMRQSLTTVLAVTFSCLVSALTCFMVLGFHTDVSFVPEMLFDYSLLPWVIVLGAICGVYSVYYAAIIKRFGAFMERIPNIWRRALIGGVSLAVMLFMFPSLYGEGYSIIGKLMANDSTSIIAYGPFYNFGVEHFWLLCILFGALLLVKPWATGATNESGGVGGDFTPTLFCGGVLGFIFGAALNHYFHMHLPVALFAFFGMAAVMSGAKEAPLMAIFITAEMTGLYGFILPLSLTAIASIVVTIILRSDKVVSRYFKIPDYKIPFKDDDSKPAPPSSSSPTSPGK